MSAEPPKEHPRAATKLARMRDAYRQALQRPDLTDREIDDMRPYVIRLAQALCEHVWGKRFY
jgi:hypothetical protein